MLKKLKKHLQDSPFFILLLPVFFIMHGQNEVFGFFTFKTIFLNFFLVSAGTLTIYASLLLLFHNKPKAGFAGFLITVFLLTFGPLHDYLKEITGESLFSKFIFLLPATVIVISFFLFGTYRSKMAFTSTFYYLNILMISFVTIEVITTLRLFASQPVLMDDRFTVLHQYENTKTQTQPIKPDIFFFVFDGMPSSLAMEQAWNYNNNALDSALIKEGFYVARQSKSNYNITMLSVTSTFNMEYLTPAQIYTGGEMEMIRRASPSLLKNSTTEILKKEGYSIFQYQPLSIRNKDWDGSLLFVDLLTNHFWFKTLPGRIFRDLSWKIRQSKLMKAIAYKKKEAQVQLHIRDFYKTIQLINQNCIAKKKPAFTYAHFILPHEPFVFDSTGKLLPVTIKELTDEEKVAYFLAQVKFADKTIIELIQTIKKNNPNSIILIEGDHGYRNIYGNEYMIFDNLNAIYYSDADYAAFTPDQSPVNSFRHLFNKYFSTRLPKLKDSSSYIPYNLKPVAK